MELVLAAARLLDPVDAARRRWLRALGSLARPLMRDRQLRVALVASGVIVSATTATLLAPLLLLALGPIAWGVPHLLADLRYLVIGPGYHRRRALVLLAGGPIVAVGLGAGLLTGLLAAVAAALLARASWRRRLLALVGIGALGVGLWALGGAADVAFAHGHNFVAVALWWWWRPRRGALRWLPVALFAGATALFLSEVGAAWVAAGSGFGWSLGQMGVEYQLWRLTPGIEEALGIRLVLLFAFAQAIHYAVWLHLIPDDDRERATPATFSRSYRELCAAMGPWTVAIAGALAAGLVGWALFDLMAANHGYFRLARFHGHLELCAATLLLLEGRRR